jgi:hypothetical protein
LRGLAHRAAYSLGALPVFWYLVLNFVASIC